MDWNLFFNPTWWIALPISMAAALGYVYLAVSERHGLLLRVAQPISAFFGVYTTCALVEAGAGYVMAFLIGAVVKQLTYLIILVTADKALGVEYLLDD